MKLDKSYILCIQQKKLRSIFSETFLTVQNLKLFEKNKIFQTTCFNHTTIFFKLTDQYKSSDVYINHNNCIGHMLITQLL